MLCMMVLIRLCPESKQNARYFSALCKGLSDGNQSPCINPSVLFPFIGKSHSLEQQKVLQSLSDFWSRVPLKKNNINQSILNKVSMEADKETLSAEIRLIN